MDGPFLAIFPSNPAPNLTQSPCWRMVLTRPHALHKKIHDSSIIKGEKIKKKENTGLGVRNVGLTLPLAFLVTLLLSFHRTVSPPVKLTNIDPGA